MFFTLCFNPLTPEVHTMVSPDPELPKTALFVTVFSEISKPIFRLYGTKSKTCRPVFRPYGKPVFRPYVVRQLIKKLASLALSSILTVAFNWNFTFAFSAFTLGLWPWPCMSPALLTSLMQIMANCDHCALKESSHLHTHSILIQTWQNIRS